MLELQNQLETTFSNLYRRIWIQRSRSKNDICITLFPISITEKYRIIIARNLHEMSFVEIAEIISLT